VRFYKTLRAVFEDPAAFKLTDEQSELAWAYAYRFFFDFPRPFPWHVVSLWDDYEDARLADIYKSKAWTEYESIFKYLSGEPIDWTVIRDNSKS
jgi:hypothetical protein